MSDPAGPGRGAGAPGETLVTYLPEAGAGPVRVEGRTVLEPASPVVWFTFPGALHDIGRFHTPAGVPTGLYANILTPVEILGPDADGVEVWRTTDLFLDVFVAPDGEPRVLDRDELETAVARGWIAPRLARAAEREAARLVAAARTGHWPPAVVGEWTLAKARAAAQGRRRPGGTGQPPPGMQDRTGSATGAEDE